MYTLFNLVTFIFYYLQDEDGEEQKAEVPESGNGPLSIREEEEKSYERLCSLKPSSSAKSEETNETDNIENLPKTKRKRVGKKVNKKDEKSSESSSKNESDVDTDVVKTPEKKKRVHKVKKIKSPEKSSPPESSKNKNNLSDSSDGSGGTYVKSPPETKIVSRSSPEKSGDLNSTNVISDSDVKIEKAKKKRVQRKVKNITDEPKKIESKAKRGANRKGKTVESEEEIVQNDDPVVDSDEDKLKIEDSPEVVAAESSGKIDVKVPAAKRKPAKTTAKRAKKQW